MYTAFQRKRSRYAWNRENAQEVLLRRCYLKERVWEVSLFERFSACCCQSSGDIWPWTPCTGAPHTHTGTYRPTLTALLRLCDWPSKKYFLRPPPTPQQEPPAPSSTSAPPSSPSGAAPPSAAGGGAQWCVPAEPLMWWQARGPLGSTNCGMQQPGHMEMQKSTLGQTERHRVNVCYSPGPANHDQTHTLTTTVLVHYEYKKASNAGLMPLYSWFNDVHAFVLLLRSTG